MSSDGEEIRSLLDATQRRVAATPDERARVRAAMFDVFDEINADPDAGEAETPVQLLEVAAPTPNEALQSHRQRRWFPALAAAAAVVVTVAAIAVIGSRDDAAPADNPVVPEATISTIATVPTTTPDPAPEAREVVEGSVLTEGRYRVELGGSVIEFDAAPGAQVVALTDHRLTVEMATDASASGAVNRVTLFVGQPLMSADERREWLDERTTTLGASARLFDGEVTQDWLVDVLQTECETWAPCVPIAAPSPEGFEPSLMAGGINRVFFVDSINADGDSLIVLGTFISSDETSEDDFLNPLLNSLTISDT